MHHSNPLSAVIPPTLGQCNCRERLITLYPQAAPVSEQEICTRLQQTGAPMASAPVGTPSL